MKRNLVKRLVSFILACIMLSSILTVQSFATSDIPEENTNLAANAYFEQEVGDNTFSLRGRFCDVIESHSEYGEKEYLAYTWMDEFIIWFFDDIDDVKFRSYGKSLDGYFGILPSKDVTFTAYSYSYATLNRSSKKVDQTFAQSNGYSYSLRFVASFDIYTDDSYTEYFYKGVDSLPNVNPQEDIVTYVNGRTFSMPGRYADVIMNHPYYNGFDYLAYLDNDEFSYWVFADNLSNVTFSMRSKGAGYFTIDPSKDVVINKYIYDRNTLNFKSLETTIFSASNSNQYTFTYEFAASFRIHQNGTTFYNNVGMTPPPDVVRQTNGRTFTVKGQHYDLITNDERYEDMEYLAFGSDDEFFVWFFEDLSDTKFSVTYSDDNSFQLAPSSNISFMQLIYDKASLQQRYRYTTSLLEGQSHTFENEFIASFDIYTNSECDAFFYWATTPTIEFEPLEEQEAKNFLKFILGQEDLANVNIEEKLPQYYNLLVGNISDPDEKAEATASFLLYCYYCFAVQSEEANNSISTNTSYLIEWLIGNTDSAGIVCSEIEGEVFDSLKQTIASQIDIPALAIGGIVGIDLLDAINEYGEILVYSLNAFEAISIREEINYLVLYKNYLKALEEGDEITIMMAEASCEIARENMSTPGLNRLDEMEKYAQYIFDIERNFIVV